MTGSGVPSTLFREYAKPNRLRIVSEPVAIVILILRYLNAHNAPSQCGLKLSIVLQHNLVQSFEPNFQIRGMQCIIEPL